MSLIPDNLKFASSHEWLRFDGNNLYTVGISDHAQGLLGDMVFIDLPEVGDTVEAEEDCAVAESVKAASDIYAPVAGTVVAINETLGDQPELVNSDPYGDGWLFQLKIDDVDQVEALLNADDYEQLIADEE